MGRIVLEVGDFVVKRSGYEPFGIWYPGWVVSVFKTRADETRYVVEHAFSKGMLHIFNETQLEKVSKDVKKKGKLHVRK